MRPTASAPDGAAATIAGLPPHGRTAVLVVLAVVGLVCVSAALFGVASLLAGPRRRHGAARSTFYLAAMPTPLAAPGRHRHRRRSAVVRWTAWPNPLSARGEPGDAAARATVRPVVPPHGANPAGREVTPDRSRMRAQQRARRRAEQEALRSAERRTRHSRRAQSAAADAPVPGSTTSDVRGALPGGVTDPNPVGTPRPAGRPVPRRQPPRRTAVSAGVPQEFEDATGAAEVLRRLAELALPAAAAGAAAVVLRLPDGLRIAAVADAQWPWIETPDGRRRGCEPEAAASAVGWWRRLVEAVDDGRVDDRAGKGWARGGAAAWAGGPARRGTVADGQGRPRSLLACPVRVGSRTVGALLATRDAGEAFTSAEAAAVAGLVDAAAEVLLRHRGPVVDPDDPGEPGSRAELLSALQALLPGAAVPGWAPVVVAVRLTGGHDSPGDAPSSGIEGGEGDAAAPSLVATVTQALRQVMREEDRIYSWGAGELVVVCPDLPRGRRAGVVARLRRCATTVVAEASSSAGVDVGWAAASSGSAVKAVARARRAASPALTRGAGPDGVPGTHGQVGASSAPAASGVPSPRVSSERPRVGARRRAGG